MSDANRNVLGSIPDSVGTTVRGNDIEHTAEQTPEFVITLERINSILLKYLSDIINPTVNVNGMARRVPVQYLDPERWKTIRKDGFMRDPNTTKVFAPLLILHRSAVRPRPLLDNPSNKYLHMALTRDWSIKNSYDRFAMLNNVQPVQTIRSIIIPDYVDIEYDGYIWTEYLAQMDAIIQQINVENHEFWGERNNFKFSVNIDGFEANDDLPADDNRIVRTQFRMKVSGYLMPEKMVQNMRTASTNFHTNTKKKVVAFTEIVNTVPK